MKNIWTAFLTCFSVSTANMSTKGPALGSRFAVKSLNGMAGLSLPKALKEKGGCSWSICLCANCNSRKGNRPMATNSKQSITILVADDDPDDRQMTKEAFQESLLVNDLRFVEDGEELLDYLHQRGKYAAEGAAPLPGLILLDLNMPRKDGREALQEIKANPKLRSIRGVIMTPSKAEEDVVRSYDLSAASYITKPVTFERLVDVVRTLGKYWLEIVELPPNWNGTPKTSGR